MDKKSALPVLSQISYDDFTTRNKGLYAETRSHAFELRVGFWSSNTPLNINEKIRIGCLELLDPSDISISTYTSTLFSKV